MHKITIALVFTITSLSAWAKPQIVTLNLPTMNCAMCPITVKKALSKVKGVTKAEVTFEDTQTSAGKLIEATTNAGYPSTLVETETP